MRNNKVILVVGQDRREMVREALIKLGDDFVQKVKNSKKIFIHPNLVTFHRKEATTDPEAVRGVIDHISLIRGDEILIGDASYYDTKKAWQNFGWESLKRSGNIKFIDLNDDETIETFAYDSDFKKRPIGFSKTVAESDFNIIVVPAKMHSYYIVSLSIKTHIIGSMVVPVSPFGIHARWPWFHTGYKQAHMSLAENYIKFPAQLAIIDGTQAMEGNGPTSGDEVNLGWLLASFNPICADALACYLMGFEPEEIGYLYYLKEKGWGPINIEEMEIIGPDPRKLRRKLKRPDSYPAIMAWK